MHPQRRFVRFVLVLAAIVLAVFFLEFLGEWLRQGRPGFDALFFSGPNLGKPADFLSPTARAYNNILAMVLATIALAIPLTANMYTAKLIDMFLRDRINQFMLFFWAILAAHVIFVLYLSGPDFTPAWMIRASVLGAILGWIALVPYFYYIVRFLDPTRILARIKDEALEALRQAEQRSIAVRKAQETLNQNLRQICTIVLKTIGRGEREVTLEGIRCLQDILQQYGERKARMPEDWFNLAPEHFVGLSAEALALLHEERNWVEHRVLSEIFLAYKAALAATQDVISSLSQTSREIALAADRRGDDKALELTVKFFNNYLRETVKRRDLLATYDLIYQYRLLADALWHRPALLRKIGGYLLTYSNLAEASGLPFVPQIVAVDLGWIVRRAYERHSEAAAALLDLFLGLKHDGERHLTVKAKLILGGYFTQGDHAIEAGKLRTNLASVPTARLRAAGDDLSNVEDRSYWEVTDRQMMFEWVPPQQRPAVQAFLESIQAA
ncbi:MAG TPA: DUF2254 family protein [Gemmataceae bacterium]|nr:DUF2254 family protein [Gemmataceae bacterium]